MSLLELVARFGFLIPGTYNFAAVGCVPKAVGGKEEQAKWKTPEGSGGRPAVNPGVSRGFFSKDTFCSIHHPQGLNSQLTHRLFSTRKSLCNYIVRTISAPIWKKKKKKKKGILGLEQLAGITSEAGELPWKA